MQTMQVSASDTPFPPQEEKEKEKEEVKKKRKPFCNYFPGVGI